MNPFEKQESNVTIINEEKLSLLKGKTFYGNNWQIGNKIYYLMIPKIIKDKEKVFQSEFKNVPQITLLIKLISDSEFERFYKEYDFIDYRESFPVFVAKNDENYDEIKLMINPPNLKRIFE